MARRDSRDASIATMTFFLEVVVIAADAAPTSADVAHSLTDVGPALDINCSPAMLSKLLSVVSEMGLVDMPLSDPSPLDLHLSRTPLTAILFLSSSLPWSWFPVCFANCGVFDCLCAQFLCEWLSSILSTCSFSVGHSLTT